ncbi:hypothetical protein BASA81_000179 [Batrachochytrium salamandrivorans]|nr:hypothetical protein BASA81_000179 [Batrachochytrium salamandrivorans]
MDQAVVYTCDVCEQMIHLGGVRYRCRTCKNFDLCANCVAAKHHNSKHTLYVADATNQPPPLLPDVKELERVTTSPPPLPPPSLVSPPPPPSSSTTTSLATELAVGKEQNETNKQHPPNKRVKLTKDEATTLKREMTQLTKDIEDAHIRIGLLTNILETKLSKQMLKGLLKPYQEKAM